MSNCIEVEVSVVRSILIAFSSSEDYVKAYGAANQDPTINQVRNPINELKTAYNAYAEKNNLELIK